MKEKQVHILIGCADARDLNQIQVEAVNNTITSLRFQGIDVEFHVIRTAGSFVTPDVVMDIKRTFEQAQRTCNDLTIPLVTTFLFKHTLTLLKTPMRVTSVMYMI